MSDNNEPHSTSEELTTPTLKLWTSLEDSLGGHMPARRNEHSKDSNFIQYGSNNSNAGTPRLADAHQIDTSAQDTGSNAWHNSFGLSPIDLHPSVSPISSGQAVYGDSSEFTTPNFDDQLLDFEQVLNLDGSQGEEGPEVEPLDQPTEDEPRCGVDPGSRAPMNDGEMPSLRDQENLRKVEEDKSKVETWLIKSTSNEGPDVEFDPSVSRPTGTEQRTGVSKDKNDRQNHPSGQGVDPFPAMPHPRVNEPQRYIDVEDEDEDSSDASSEANPPENVEQYRLEDEQPNHQIPQTQAAKGFKVRPWTDSPIDSELPHANGQPPSSNAAIAQFLFKARDVETASVTATLGSRRRSEADMDSLFSAAGISVRTTQAQEPEKEEKERRPTLLRRIRRSSSNVRKRKEDQSDQQDSSTPAAQRNEHQGSLSSVTKNLGAWSRPRSPKVDTDVQQSPRPTVQSPTSASSPWQSARNVIRRARSKSDLNRNNNGVSGLARQWAQQGGPPVPSLKPPATEGEEIEALQQQDHPQQESGDNEDNAPEVSPSNTVSMSLKIQEVPGAPTRDGFRNHVCRLNQDLEPFMIDRVVNEQLKRYKRLVDARKTHDRYIKSKKCPSGVRCSVVGEGPIYISGKSEKGSESAPVTFYVAPADVTPVNDPTTEHDQSSLAIFPEGIPLPPVKSLPAEFECPICFQVKKFSKPSDWTKHVHEDVQPFTCSFPNCAEPKSFKRKADWVRHENERHRQLEKWICSIDECSHTCYRRDNFVQHLVREHKLPEPRTRPTRAPSKGSGRGGEDGESTAQLVDDCHHETTKKTSEEACRFCGHLCTTWKKLTVHLAKHMEQIAMPVLDMLDQDYTFNVSGGSTRLGTSHSNGAPHLNAPSRGNSASPLSSAPSNYDHSSSHNVLGSGPFVGSTYPPAGVARSPYNSDFHAYTPTTTSMGDNAHSPVSAYSGSDFGMQAPMAQHATNTTTSYPLNTLNVPAPSFAQNAVGTVQQRSPSPATYPPAWHGTNFTSPHNPSTFAPTHTFTASPTEAAPYNAFETPEANGGPNLFETRHYSAANGVQQSSSYFMNHGATYEDQGANVVSHPTTQSYNTSDTNLTGMYAHTSPAFNNEWQYTTTSQGYDGYEGR
ncbi:MAG: hypothetical protein M1831_002866 [Alyxoria varia]|nr:MAG: hypothetical protein M1831_002866 [Alyxoria varia]